MVSPLLDVVTTIKGRIFEPCVGHGHISSVLDFSGLCVITNDLDEKHQADFHLDATKESSWKKFTKDQSFDWIITNPPFNGAFDILKNSLSSGANVALLVRLSFLEPTFERQEFLAKNPPSGMIVLPRYSFTENGKTDSVTCAWLVWCQGLRGSIYIAKKSRKERLVDGSVKVKKKKAGLSK
jgi:hypothetical protein